MAGCCAQAIAVMAKSSEMRIKRFILRLVLVDEIHAHTELESGRVEGIMWSGEIVVATE